MKKSTGDGISYELLAGRGGDFFFRHVYINPFACAIEMTQASSKRNGKGIFFFLHGLGDT